MKNNMEKQFNPRYAKRANMLLLGPIKAGKSSFVNSIASICKDRIANVALTGEAADSFTTKVSVFCLFY